MNAAFERTSPVTGEITWAGRSSTGEEIALAMRRAQSAFSGWSRTNVDTRSTHLKRYAEYLQTQRDAIANTITLETGKPLWESRLEIASSVAKVGLAIDAFRKRRDSVIERGAMITSQIVYRALGPVLVLGPFNLPVHLPGAHIVPALLAGNTVVFKPSEKTPAVGDWIARAWAHAGLPDGVFHCLHGDAQVARAALEAPEVSGVLFTGSLSAGVSIHRHFAGRPDVLVALEMGGNNGLVVDRANDVRGAAEVILQSAYITSGQRCTCARRLLLIENEFNRELLSMLTQAIPRLKVANPLAEPTPFIGTLIDAPSAQRVLAAQQTAMEAGMQPLVTARCVNELGTQLSPGMLLDEVGIAEDEEVFGPLLIVQWVPTLEAAIDRINASRYGLSAGLISPDAQAFELFLQRVKAGIINWNQPTTGATGTLPFGGIGWSGNHRPSGYYAADYCSDPVASIQRAALTQAEIPHVGMEELWEV